MNIQRLDSKANDFSIALDNLLHFDQAVDLAIDQRVDRIIAGVRKDGDLALLNLTSELDGWKPNSVESLKISGAEVDAALEQVSPEQSQALHQAAARIQTYHEYQRQESWSVGEEDGTTLGQKVTPLDSAGVYVPGGKASYPSSVMMNVIPARVAGVERICMVVPTPGGVLNPLVLAAAKIAGVHEIYRIGGAQAIAALAFGTQSIDRVDKIVGPGNIYVATAKQKVFGRVGLDMIAGPSEVLIICDGKTDPDWIALDMFAQAEHDEIAQSILLSPDSSYLDAVQESIERLLPTMSRRTVIEASLENRGALIKVADLDDAIAISNKIAPEHLELSVADPEACLASVVHAGAVFMGRHTPEAFGDYCAGPNHVLPTSSTARFSSPLGVYDFQKRTSVINCSVSGASKLAKVASVLARGEGLEAHARSAEARRGISDDT